MPWFHLLDSVSPVFLRVIYLAISVFAFGICLVFHQKYAQQIFRLGLILFFAFLCGHFILEVSVGVRRIQGLIVLVDDIIFLSIPFVLGGFIGSYWARFKLRHVAPTAGQHSAKYSHPYRWTIWALRVFACCLLIYACTRTLPRYPPVAPVPAPPLTTAQQAILQGITANFISQLTSERGIKLVPIPAGTYLMGSPEDEKYSEPNEGPQTKVILSQYFFLGATDVTQSQYAAVMDSTPSHFSQTNADAPVENVSWLDAMSFCQKLTLQEHIAGHLPEDYAFTLPTEAQWEYACRAGTTGPNTGDLDTTAWFGKTSGQTTHQVSTKQPNVWGLYDMYGNVKQWCLDWYGNYPGGMIMDPTGPSSGTYRVVRGSDWTSATAQCRSAVRNFALPASSNRFIGFRIALSRASELPASKQGN